MRKLVNTPKSTLWTLFEHSERISVNSVLEYEYHLTITDVLSDRLDSDSLRALFCK